MDRKSSSRVNTKLFWSENHSQNSKKLLGTKKHPQDSEKVLNGPKTILRVQKSF